MTFRSQSVGSLAAVLLIAALVAGCCAPVRVVWIPEGKPQTLVDSEQTARDADISYASGTDPEDAPDLRGEVLVWLRERGPDGDRAASLLTQGFPARVKAVPVHVEIASVDGTRSLIVVEAIAGSPGRLDARRLWVFEMDSGRLVRSTSFR